MAVCLKRLAASSLIALAFIGPAHAETKCGDRMATLQELHKKYGERLVFRGLSTEGGMMVELYKSKTGTWTILVTSPNYPGTVCRLDSGRGAFAPALLKGEWGI